MNWLTTLGFAAVVVLGWILYQRFGPTRIAAFNDRRRAGSKIVSTGQFVDGSRHIDVALALTGSTLYYECSAMQASIDLEWVREVEYDTKLATGAAIGEGRVLRLRSQSQAFEFVLPPDLVTRWYTLLPPASRSRAAAAAH